MRRITGHKLLISLFVFGLYFSQGLALSVCDHERPREKKHGHCHESKTEAATQSRASQWSKSKASECPMCLSGNCFVSQSVATFNVVDLAQSLFDIETISYLKVWDWDLILKQSSQIFLRPPPQIILLPQSQNWQAFFSIFRN